MRRLVGIRPSEIHGKYAPANDEIGIPGVESARVTTIVARASAPVTMVCDGPRLPMPAHGQSEFNKPVIRWMPD